MTVLPDASSTRVRSPASALIEALVPVAMIFPSATATASVTVDRSSKVRTLPLTRTRSGALSSGCCASAFATPATNMPVARIANAFNLRTIAYPLGSFLLWRQLQEYLSLNVGSTLLDAWQRRTDGKVECSRG